MQQEISDLTLQTSIQAVIVRMNEYEAASVHDTADPDREAELQDYFDQLNAAFAELADIYLSRVQHNALLPSLDALLVTPFPLR